METNSTNIDLINAFLNNELAQEDRTDFESKIQKDSAFKALYEEHVVFIKGLERIQVKKDISKAKQTYNLRKWIKISGVSLVAILALVMLVVWVFKASETAYDSQDPPKQSLIIVSDSIPISKSKTETDSITIDESTKTTSSQDTYVTSAVKQTYGSLSSTQKQLQKRAQKIKINTEKDTIITCSEGTVLHIKKESFVNPNTGSIVTGPVDLYVTEYYELSDILLAKLSTVSNDQQLETGGMLYIEAKQGDTSVDVRPNASIDIMFPTSDKKPGMQLFDGQWNDDTINWTLQSQADELIEDIEIEEGLIEVPFNVVEVAPIFPGCENSIDNDARKQCTKEAISQFITRNFNTDIGFGTGLSGQQRLTSFFKIDNNGNVGFIQTNAPHPTLSQEANRVLGLLPQMIPGKQRGRNVTVPYSLPINLFIDNKGISSNITRDSSLIQLNPRDFDTIYVTRRGITERIREIMHDKDFQVDSLFLEQWEQYKKQRLIREINASNDSRYILRKSLFEMTDSKFKILEDDSITRGGHVIRIPWDSLKVPTTSRIMRIVPKQRFSAGRESVSEEDFLTRLEDEGDTTLSSRDVTNYYMLKTSNLGWINCDRFINGRSKRIKYKLKIKNPDGAVVSMVFKSYNSVLPSWYRNGAYDFQNVLENEQVILVAIKRKEGKLYYDVIETQTEVNPNVDFNFKEVSVEEFKSKIEDLKNLIE
ncbi:hypothetical protein AB9K26_11120 [Psychroserpens sp. XS_ASV72]|uniref:hypothetical protein n=1 Tax=Psychroserpens sp. XS_ASV72 TaxID=3241293 RepID=UPI0035110C56